MKGACFPSRSPFIFLLYPSCFVCEDEEEEDGGWGRAVVCPPTPPRVSCAPDGHNPTEKQCVNNYLAVVSTRTRVVSPLHLLATCVYQMLWRASMTSPSLTCYPSLSIFYTVSLLLQDVKTYFRSPLCRFAMPTPTPTPILRSASPPLSLTSLPVLLATSLQQNVCRRLILGYNRWYFFPLPTHTRSLSLFAMSCPFC